MISSIFNIISRIILFIIGWKPIPQHVFDKLNRYDRSIVIFSHTSYADFYILVLYLLSEPDKLKNIRTITKPQPFDWPIIGNILRNIGAIPATKVEDKNGGAVSRIVNELKKSERCNLLISPKGTINKREWRSGYYHIGKELDAHFLVTGLDYKRKAIVMFDDKIDTSFGEEMIRIASLDGLSKIVPLYPEREFGTEQYMNGGELTIVNWKRLCFISTVLCLFLISWILGLL